MRAALNTCPQTRGASHPRSISNSHLLSPPQIIGFTQHGGLLSEGHHPYRPYRPPAPLSRCSSCSKCDLSSLFSLSFFFFFPSVSSVDGDCLLQPGWPLPLAVPENSFLHCSVSLLFLPNPQYPTPWEGGGRERCGVLTVHLLFFFFSTIYTVCENDSIMVKWVLFKLKYFFILVMVKRNNPNVH